MHARRRIRGLIGSAITWGVAGGFIGAAMFLVRYQPWPLDSIRWGRMLQLLLTFVGLGALWGSVCGLAFGAVLWRVSRSANPQRLSPSRLMLWGAIGGAAFPLLLYTPIVLARGSFGAVPFYAMLTGISAVFGAVCARAVFALAARAPGRDAEDVAHAALAGAPFVHEAEVALETRERVR